MEVEFQKNLVVNNKKLTYKGIFRADELFKIVNTALEEKGYEKREKSTEELVTEQGRKLYLELRPIKEKTRYAALMIKIKINLDNVTETQIEVEGIPETFYNGDITFTFDAWVLYDYLDRWGMKPWVFFVKGIINKFLFTWPQEASFPGEVAGDTAHVYVQVQKLLNSYGSGDAKLPSEEEVRAQIEEEMKKEKDVMWE